MNIKKIARPDLNRKLFNIMLPCLKCDSDKNGYYTSRSRTCRKCTNKITVETKNRRARLEGYRSYYQKLKLKEYE